MNTWRQQPAARSLTLQSGPLSWSGRKHLTGTMTRRITQSCIGLRWVSVSMIYHSDSFTDNFRLVLHPCHKLRYFQHAGWTVDWITTAKKLVRDKFDCSYHFWEDVTLISPKVSSNEVPSNVFNNLPAFRPIEFGTFNELTCYLHSNNEDVKNKHLLQWWCEHKHVYPHLSWMALDYHTIPCKSLMFLLCFHFRHISYCIHI